MKKQYMLLVALFAGLSCQVALSMENPKDIEDLYKIGYPVDYDLMGEELMPTKTFPWVYHDEQMQERISRGGITKREAEVELCKVELAEAKNEAIRAMSNARNEGRDPHRTSEYKKYMDLKSRCKD